MTKTYIMKQSVFTRILNRTGDVPRCINYDIKIELGSKYVSTSNTSGKYSTRCEKCAKVKKLI